ncbi:uncharacterized protein V1513DRAFT_134274 [Lipomyces chichibuensis]|uniref:uncharacterized protein n=1 Tax=Lipomyces chichibuensis TaxID=1546026 RepID=UPI0033433FFE
MATLCDASSMAGQRDLLIDHENLTTSDPLARLPSEVFANILLQLRFKDVLQCTKVCRKWQEFAEGYPPLWSYINLRYDDGRESDATVSEYIHRGKGTHLCLSSSLSNDYRHIRGVRHIVALKIDVCAFNYVMCDITSGMFEKLRSLQFYFSQDSTIHKAMVFIIWTVTAPTSYHSLEMLSFEGDSTVREWNRMLLEPWDFMKIMKLFPRLHTLYLCGLKITSDCVNLEAMEELRNVILLNCTFSTMPTIPSTCSELVVDRCNVFPHSLPYQNMELSNVALRNYPYNNVALQAICSHCKWSSLKKLDISRNSALKFSRPFTVAGKSLEFFITDRFKCMETLIVGSTVTDDALSEFRKLRELKYLVIQDAQQVTARGFHNLLYFGRRCSRFGKLMYLIALVKYIVVNMKTQKIMCSDHISLAHLHYYLLELDGVCRVVESNVSVDESIESWMNDIEEFETPEQFAVNTDLCASTVIADWQRFTQPIELCFA